jgi:hypothetical protein
MIHTGEFLELRGDTRTSLVSSGSAQKRPSQAGSRLDPKSCGVDSKHQKTDAATTFVGGGIDVSGHSPPEEDDVSDDDDSEVWESDGPSEFSEYSCLEDDQGDEVRIDTRPDAVDVAAAMLATPPRPPTVAQPSEYALTPEMVAGAVSSIGVPPVTIQFNEGFGPITVPITTRVREIRDRMQVRCACLCH